MGHRVGRARKREIRGVGVVETPFFFSSLFLNTGLESAVWKGHALNHRV